MYSKHNHGEAAIGMDAPDATRLEGTVSLTRVLAAPTAPLGLCLGYVVAARLTVSHDQRFLLSDAGETVEIVMREELMNCVERRIVANVQADTLVIASVVANRRNDGRLDIECQAMRLAEGAP